MNWHIPKQDLNLVMDIAARAHTTASALGIDYPIQIAQMDITATHANGCPLDLEGLASADRVNFVHDVFGIRNHLNRDTGELEDCFVPRYAAKYAVK